MMKKIIIAILILGLFNLPSSFGQSPLSYSKLLKEKQNKVNIGLALGVSLTNFNWSNPNFLDRDNLAIIRHAGGLNVQYNFPKLFSIQTGVLLEGRGAANQFEGLDSNGMHVSKIIVRRAFDYITIPTLFKITLPLSNSKIRVFFTVGPSVSFLTRTTQSKISNPLNPNLPTTKVVLTRSKSPTFFDVGISLGTGFEIALNKQWLLTIETRLTQGFFDVFDLSGWETLVLKDSNNWIDNAPKETLYNSISRMVRTKAASFTIGLAYRIGTR